MPRPQAKSVCLEPDRMAYEYHLREPRKSGDNILIKYVELRGNRYIVPAFLHRLSKQAGAERTHFEDIHTMAQNVHRPPPRHRKRTVRTGFNAKGNVR